MLQAGLWFLRLGISTIGSWQNWDAPVNLRHVRPLVPLICDKQLHSITRGTDWGSLTKGEVHLLLVNHTPHPSHDAPIGEATPVRPGRVAW